MRIYNKWYKELWWWIVERFTEPKVIKCEMFLDHEPVWDGGGWHCWKCGLIFKPTGEYINE